jgi:thioredoxin-like negative regulator of GroEL
MDYKLKYLKYKQKYLSLKNYNQLGGSGKPNLYLFKAEWCKHCKNFKDTWEKLQHNKTLKEKVNFITVDHADSHKFKDFNIEGYPTILLVNNNKKVEFNEQRNESNVINFIDKHIN